MTQPEVVAYGYENTRPTGERHSLMMVKLDNIGDQYPELATPLIRLSAYTALQARYDTLEERYRVLRDQRHGFRAHRLDPKPGKRWRGWSDEGRILKGDALDQAIDDAIEVAMRSKP